MVAWKADPYTVNLTILAPDIVAVMLDDMLPPGLTLFDFAVDPPRCGRSSVSGLGYDPS